MVGTGGQKQAAMLDAVAADSYLCCYVFHLLRRRWRLQDDIFEQLWCLVSIHITPMQNASETCIESNSVPSNG